jgi:hypothetical protein
MTFEIRNNFEKIKELQLQSMDDDLRNMLWNVHEILFDNICPLRGSESDKRVLNILLEHYWIYFFKQPINRLKDMIYPKPKIDEIRRRYFGLQWFKVYSFLEVTAKFLENHMTNRYQSYREECNFLLEAENSAFRFVGSHIVSIISSIEIEEIEINLKTHDESAQHIESALTQLSNKENDQARESVIQSILAVEAIAKKVTGNSKATLADLCNSKVNLPAHSQFRQALLNLYNYTSGSDGIRHSLTESSQPVSKSLARFMLIVCSAFVSLIRSESNIAIENCSESEL